MDRRTFLKNSIGALLLTAIESNSILSTIVENIPKNSMDVLLYAVQTKCGKWKIKATKWINLNEDKLKNTEFIISSFTPLGIFDNSVIKENQTKFAKQYKAVRSLHSVDHYQCTINGKNYPVVKQATFSSRSNGGKTRIIQNKKSGYWEEMTKKYSSINGKKNIKHTKTKYALLAQKNSATWTFEQLKEDGSVVKTYRGVKSFDNTKYTYASVRFHCDTKTLYKGYYWRIKNKTNKNHKKSQWTESSIKKAAKECSYKAEFKGKYQSAYHLAKRLGIFDEITKHMKRPKAKNQYTKNLVM